MDAKKRILAWRLVPTLALALGMLFLLTLLPAGTGATDLASGAPQGLQTARVSAQGSTDVDVPLGGAGEWARASVEVASAPTDAVVSAVQVKYHVVYLEAADLEVQLLASGAEGAYGLGDGGSAEGGVLAQSTGEMAAFQGAPVNGTWSLAVQSGGAEGYIDDFSIVVYYEMEMPVLQVEGGGEPGVPAFLRLPEGMAPASVSPGSDERAGEGVFVVPQDVPPGATIIATEDFEGPFPTPPWQATGWGVAGCDPCGGDRAAWPAAGGANRVDPCAGNGYPNNMDSWMVYGPFDLSRATTTGTDFTMWFDTEPDYDRICVCVSSDGSGFNCTCWSGSAPCAQYSITYQDWIGVPSVWVAWVFQSDGSVTDRGAWVDDVVIWKGGCGATVKISPSAVTATTGSPFSFDVAIENAANLGAFQFDVTYPTSLAGNDPNQTCATIGPFLGRSGRSVTPVNPYCGSGIVTYAASSTGSNAGPSGNGVLATVHLKTTDITGTGTVELQNVVLTNPAGTGVCARTLGATVNVTSTCLCNPSCPEDLNCDGKIDIRDIMLVASKAGMMCPPRPVSTGATDLASGARQGLQTARVSAQGSTDVDVPLGGAGEWARASVEIASAPADAVVSAVRVKYHVVYPEAASLEVQLLASGAEGVYALGDGGSTEGGVLAQSTGEMAAFQGAPVNGTWSLAVQGGGAEGYIDDFGVIVYYELEVPVLQVEGGGEPGVPAFLRLPEGMAPASVSPGSDERAGEGVFVVPQDVPPGAAIIATEDFEGPFPTPPWQATGWGVAGCDPCGGDRAAWSAAGAPYWIDPCAGNNYRNNQQSWMVYGPFDLSGATNAGTEFTMWFDTEMDWDYVFFGVSHDGINFSGVSWTGYRSCTPYGITYNDWLGDPSVWVAWVFHSDGSITDRGVWVDDITIWGGCGAAVVKISPPAITATTDSPFSFNVVIENAVNLGAFQFDVAYPTSLAGNDPNQTCATIGPFLGSTGRSVVPVNPSCGSGIVTYGAFSTGSNAGPNGNGVLATVHLQAGSNPGSGPLHLQNVVLTNPAGAVQCAVARDGTIGVRDLYSCDNSCPRDVDGDGVITIIDIQMVASKFGQLCPTR